MAIKFEFYRTPDTEGTSKKRYYARVVNFRHVSTDALASSIQQRCTLTEADVHAVLVSLGQELAWHLKEGERVHVEGLGYFQVTLKCPETKNPKDTRSRDVKVRTVRFRPDKRLLELMRNAETERSDIRPHSAKCSDEKLEKLLAEFFRERGGAYKTEAGRHLRLYPFYCGKGDKEACGRRPAEERGGAHPSHLCSGKGNFGK